MEVSVALWLLPTSIVVVLCYLIGFLSFFWSKRQILSEAIIALNLVGLVFLCMTQLLVVGIIILAAFHLWMIMLAFRLLASRLPEEFLQQSTQRNVAFGIPLYIVVVLLVFGLSIPSAATANQVLAFSAIFGSLIIGSILVYQVAWTLQHFRLRKLNQYLTMRELPTVSLVIPARNETHALMECLTAATASDYLKLETLVLDDCSQDKTSEVIRSFAHDGVRFVQGSSPADGWLGKNQACKTLAEQASGEYIVFADVDTHLSPQSLTRLLAYVVSNDLEMVTVLPQRREGISLATALWQLRYYWQIVMPMTRRRIPVASQLWLIKAETLHRLGGFDAVRHKIVPEGSFARRLFAQNKYRFLLSDAELGITTAKRWSSQNDTAIRFLYPTFKRQPLAVLLGCLSLMIVMLLPFMLAIGLALANQLNLLWWLSMCAVCLLLVGYGLVVMRAVPRVWLVLLVTFPLSLAQEIVLLLVSMLAYEFAEVNWKGRNVCYPVMTAFKHLR